MSFFYVGLPRLSLYHAFLRKFTFAFKVVSLVSKYPPPTHTHSVSLEAHKTCQELTQVHNVSQIWQGRFIFPLKGIRCVFPGTSSQMSCMDHSVWVLSFWFPRLSFNPDFHIPPLSEGLRLEDPDAANMLCAHRGLRSRLQMEAGQLPFPQKLLQRYAM